MASLGNKNAGVYSTFRRIQREPEPGLSIPGALSTGHWPRICLQHSIPGALSTGHWPWIHLQHSIQGALRSTGRWPWICLQHSIPECSEYRTLATNLPPEQHPGCSKEQGCWPWICLQHSIRSALSTGHTGHEFASNTVYDGFLVSHPCPAHLSQL